MRRRLRHGIVALACALLLPSQSVFALSKSVEKAFFIGGLLALGGVVRALVQRDMSEAERARARLRETWGEPTSVVLYRRGFDRYRVERYERDGRRATAVYRNERLIRVLVEARRVGRRDRVPPDVGDDGVGLRG